MSSTTMPSVSARVCERTAPREAFDRGHLAFPVAIIETHLALPVVGIRQYAVITGIRQPSRNIEQLLAQAPHVHQDDDGGARRTFRMRDESIHAPGGSLDIGELFDHRVMQRAAVHFRSMAAATIALDDRLVKMHFIY